MEIIEIMNKKTTPQQHICVHSSIVTNPMVIVFLGRRNACKKLKLATTAQKNQKAR